MDVESLKMKLSTYMGQLQQVSVLLATEPDNEQYQGLAKDLTEAIRLTQELIQSADGGNAQTQGEEQDDLQLRKDHSFKPGDRCDAPWGDKYFPAVVMRVSEDDTVTVRYIGYPDEAPHSRSVLKPLVSEGTIDPAAAVPGFQCQGRWAGDGRYYDVIIQEATEFGYRILFTKYGDVQEVPIEYLKPKFKGVKRAAETGAVTNPDGTVTFVIPDHLKILPTDTEEEKMRKRKKVKHLKSHFKAKEKEEENNEKQQSWKDYMNKTQGKKKVKTLGLTGMKKGSIFASPDTVDGKVGVVGSGQGMTDFETRKKYEFAVPPR